MIDPPGTSQGEGRRSRDLGTVQHAILLGARDVLAHLDEQKAVIVKGRLPGPGHKQIVDSPRSGR